MNLEPSKFDIDLQNTINTIQNLEDIDEITNVISLFFSNQFIKDRIDNEIDLQKFKSQLTPDGIISLQLIKLNTNNFYTCSILTYLHKIIE